MVSSTTFSPTCLHLSPSYSPFNECQGVVELQGHLCHPGSPLQPYLSGFHVLWCPGALGTSTLLPHPSCNG